MEVQFSWNKFLIIMFLSVASVFGQVHSSDSLTCVERGHIWSNVYSTTLVYYPKSIVDTDSTTIKVQQYNEVTKNCIRCGEVFTFTPKPDTTIVWRKE